MTIGIDAYPTGPSDLVLQSLVILLIFMLLGIAACMTTLVLAAHWDHFVTVLYFNSKY